MHDAENEQTGQDAEDGGALVRRRSADSPGRDALRRLLKNRLAVAGAVVILVLVLAAAFAPLVAPKPYDEGDLVQNNALPGREFPLGADFMGRDMLSRLIYGTRVSLTVGFIGAVTAFLIGITYGTISGFLGGRTDSVMMRIVDILYAFPTLLLIILLMVVFKTTLGAASKNPVVIAMTALDHSFGGLLFIMIGIGLTSWVDMARIARGMALSLRETEFVQAARALGATKGRLVLRHLMPNLIGPCIVTVTLRIPGFIGTEAFLSFIGLGVDPPTPSWGMMISEGTRVMRAYPHQAIYPGLALALVMLAFNFLGDGLRDALDPRLKR
ncbi:MAG TPA: ABC transporter permease [Spirochaetia bacterium]|nr:ABC transporter permease [Spirochaetia bacterium]